jgi:serine/threonine protein kinase
MMSEQEATGRVSSNIDTSDDFDSQGSIDDLVKRGTLLEKGEFTELFTVPLDRIVVLKTVCESASQKPEVRKRLQEQYEALVDTGNPNVMQPIGMPVWGRRIGYLLEYFEEGNLAQWLNPKQNELTKDMRDDFIEQILVGTTAMHQAGWVHGDLSARNILMSKSELTSSRWRLVIADPFPIGDRTSLVKTDIRALRRLAEDLIEFAIKHRPVD